MATKVETPEEITEELDRARQLILLLAGTVGKYKREYDELEERVNKLEQNPGHKR